jgi:L-malate glycosyltransferase
MNKSILFLTNAYPDFETSYRGVFIKKMAGLLREEGFRVSVVTPRIYQKSAYFEKVDGIEVYRFPFFAGNKLLIEHENIPYIKMSIYCLTGLLLALYVCAKNRCGLIHAHWAIPTGILGAGVSFFLKKPLCVTIHGSDLRIAKESRGLVRRLFIEVCKRASHVNCVSEVQKRETAELPGLSRLTLSVIPMGVDDAFIRNEDKKGRRTHGPPIVLSNRNLLPIYGISTLIRAIPEVLREASETQFLIAGDGPEKEKLMKEVRDLRVGSSVRFLGRVPHGEMPNLLSRADIYVSTSFHDGTSVSLLEAMAIGTYPIVSDIAPNREWIVDGENGSLVPKGDEAFLAQKIIEAIRNRHSLEAACQRNREIICEKAHWRNNIIKIEELYQSVS